MTTTERPYRSGQQAADYTIDLPPPAATEEGLNSAFSGVLQAYRDEGYRAGYARAASDLLADFILVAEQFVHDLPPEKRSELRPVLRAFENHLAMAVRSDRETQGFVDGGLGI